MNYVMAIIVSLALGAWALSPAIAGSRVDSFTYHYCDTGFRCGGS